MKIVMSLISLFLSAWMILSPSAAHAISGVYEYHRGASVIGAVTTYRTKGNESLIELARRYDIGYNSITDANPRLDAFVPGTDALVTIPSSWILPDVKSRNGIIINLSELRLYYFTKRGKSRLVRVFPVGIGREGYDSPPGTYRVVQKIVRPAWHVPKSIRKENPELPRVVPPGPENPLGSHALRLSSGDILIHGTNKPWGIGRRVSHGCIRMYPEDISRLFPLVSRGTQVTIIRQPIKAGVRNSRVYLEVHKDAFGQNSDYIVAAQALLAKKRLLKKVNMKKFYRAIHEKLGMPVDISE